MLYFLSATEMRVIYTAWEISVPPSFSGEILSTRHVQKNHRMAWAGRFFQILLLQSFDPSASVKKKKKNQICFYLFKNGLLRADEIVLVRCILWWICTYVWDLWGRNKDTFFWQALCLSLSWSIMCFFSKTWNQKPPAKGSFVW